MVILALVSSGAFSKICDDRRLNEALKVVANMEQRGVCVPSNVLFNLLQRCIREGNLAAGRELGGLIVGSGFESDMFFGSGLIRMFSMFDSLAEANQVFCKLPTSNVFSWSAIISAHANLGVEEEAVNLYHLMQKSHVEPDGYIFVAVLKSCASMAALDQGRQIHFRTVETGLESDIFVGNTLIDMYAKSGHIEDAQVLFYRLPKRDVVTWSALIAGYALHGQGQEALEIYQQMQQEGLEPDIVTFVHLLKACSNVPALEHGKLIHAHLMESGLKLDLCLGSTLVDMYAKCGNLEDACLVFDRLPMRNLVTWSALISGYAHQGYGQEALQLFQQMQEEGLMADKVMFVSLLQACSSIAALEQGKQIHAHIIQSGFEVDLFVGNILVDMYAKCRSLEDAQMMFCRMPKQDVITWSALIHGCAHDGQGQVALQLFQKMQHMGLEPNGVTYICVLKACSIIAAFQQGKQIHSQIIECGFESQLFIGSTLIDMFVKCGSLEDAQRVFERLPERDVVTWSALIAGYAQHCNYVMSVQCFEAMQQTGLKPNGVTFLCLLSACSHLGLVENGCFHFRKMKEEHGLSPTIDHHNSMVDVLGRGGLLMEAEDLLETIPFRSNLVGWTSLLGSCKTHRNVTLGRRCFDCIVTMKDESARSYVLMSSIYIHAGMRADAEKVEEMRRCVNLWKKPAKAFIEMDSQVHDFTVGDTTHPQIDAIHEKLGTLNVQMREEGYVPALDLILDPLSNEEKEDALCGHCEKLAIAFGLISAPQGTTIRVAKNLRMCADCHNVAKIISKIELREIVVTDAYCIHHFKDGVCCCKEFC